MSATPCGRCGRAHGPARDECPGRLLGETVAGRFAVVRLLGAGGSASVYKAQNTAIGRFVALKALHPWLRGDADALARFEHEGRALSRVRHEGVVDVLDLLRDEAGAPVLVLEYVRGRTLAAELERARGGFALRRAVELAGQLLATLAAVHERGLLHRDVKPSNLLLAVDARRRERLKLADFGLAVDTLRGPSRDAPREERARAPVLATPRYLAPELVRGRGKGAVAAALDERVDVYGAGLVLFELLTGRAAFEAQHVDDLVDAIVHARPPRVRALRSDVPAGLDALVERALAKQPGERFPSCVAMLDALRAFGAESDVVGAEPTDTGLLLDPPPAATVAALRASLAPPAVAVVPEPRAVSDAQAALVELDAGKPPPGSNPQRAVAAAGVPARAPSPRVAPLPALPRDLLAALEEAPEALDDALGAAPGAAPDARYAPFASRAELDALVRGHGRARAVMGATLVTALRDRFGEASLEPLLALLPAEGRAALTAPSRGDEWAPAGALLALMELADARLGRNNGALCAGFGRLAARVLLPHAHEPLLRAATPESVLVEAGALWRGYFADGELRTPSVGRGYGKLLLRGNEPRRSTCLALAGFVEVLLELAGGRDVELAIPSCRAAGDATCTFDATWIV